MSKALNILKDLIPPIITNLFTNSRGSYFYKIGGSGGFEGHDKLNLLKAYYSIPEISSIINLKARAFSMMRLEEQDINGNAITTQEGKALIELINNPNWFQGGKEFLIQTKLYRELYGNEYLFTLDSFGVKNSAIAIYTLEPTLIIPKYQSKEPYYLLTSAPDVRYYVKNSKEFIDSRLITHLNDNRVSMKSFSDEDLLKGTSKLQPLTPVINLMAASYESRLSVIKNRGANGAWVNKSKDAVGQSRPLNKLDKENLQNANDKYGTLFNQHQTIVTDQELSWVQAGTNDPRKLGLFDEIETGFNKLLDAYSVPAEMFVRANGSTYENQLQAEKGLYTRTIIPEANEWVQGITKGKLTNSKIVANFDHLPCFQNDLKAQADRLSSIVTACSKALADNAITIEQYKAMLLNYGIIKL
jgi:phage portal protein BeeE